MVDCNRGSAFLKDGLDPDLDRDSRIVYVFQQYLWLGLVTLCVLVVLIKSTSTRTSTQYT